MDRPTQRLDAPVGEDVCPKCGGLRTWADVTGANGRPLELMSREKGNIWFGHNRSRLGARVCASCGYTELYAMQPESL